MATILTPLDGSAQAEQVLPYVRLLAPLLNADVHLLRVLPEVRHDSTFAERVVTGHTRDEEVRDVARGRAEAYLETRVAVLRAIGLRVSWEVRVGFPVDTIIAVAKTMNTALITLASYSHSGSQRWSTGSVVDRVVHATLTPVLVVPSSETLSDNPALRRIIVPFDRSPLAQAALLLAAQLARAADAALIVLTAAPHQADADTLLQEYLPGGVDPGSEIQPQVLEHLGDIARSIEIYHVPVKPHVLDGFAPEVILSKATRHNADLIVMATQGSNGLRRWAGSGVTDRVLHTSDVPLIIVRVPDKSIPEKPGT